MMVLLIGVIGFLLCFIYDWNRVFWKKKWISGFFCIGCLCQIAAGSVLLYHAWERKTNGWLIWSLAACVFLTGLIYTLFFALPFDSTYCQEAGGNKVCKTGLYGLCRHPGIWWFLGCFFCFGGACGSWKAIADGLILSLINLFYAWYQDTWIFPKEFVDYKEYQKEVPFLVPFKRR